MKKRLILIGLVVTATLGLAACETTSVTVRGCGVIQDSLQGVRAMSRDGQHRLDVHFERGVAADCWGR